MKGRLDRDYLRQDVLDIAPEMPGNFLVLKGHDGNQRRFMITEVEAYRGYEDKACHASKGRTRRTEIMFHEGGFLYLYLIYGIHWMLNIVTGDINVPQAILIRAVTGYNGPGKLCKGLGIDGTYYGEDIVNSERIWIEESSTKISVESGPRIGIDYAGEYWRDIKWRFFTK